MTLGVVIVTYQRPWHLDRCLRALREHAPIVDRIIVVDGSSDRSAETITLAHDAVYLINSSGYGHMTESRNIGWRACATDYVAFIDDDAFVTPGWASAVLETLEDPSVGGMGGRAVQNTDQEPSSPSTEIGQVGPDGLLNAGFDSPGQSPIDVQHVIGCNMAFRRTILDDFDGFRADYPGTSLREETDLCFRVLAAGWRLRFEPRALVVHVGAPHARGARFDLRYQFYAVRNHAQLLVRNVGFGSMFRAHLSKTATKVIRGFARDLAATFARPVVATAGTVTGTIAGISARRRDRRAGTANQMSGRELERLLKAGGSDARATTRSAP